MSIQKLLSGVPRVVNIGLSGFAADFAAQGTPVVQVDWRPPAQGKQHLVDILARLGAHEEAIAKANAEALRRMLAANPVLVDVRPAGEVIRGLGDKVLLHSGPPVAWERMCGPMQGAVAGAIVFEEWAGDLDAAMKLAASGSVEFHPNHHFDAVGPMTGITTRSMPVMVVENRAFGNRAYCMINEGLGKVMRFGANDAEVIGRLHWLADSFGPAFGAALRSMGGLELVPLISRGLAMGDEMHQRNVACSALTLRALAPHLAKAGTPSDELWKILAFIAGNEQFFLNVGMVMGKSIMDPVRGIEHSTVVTAMCRNGTDFGGDAAGPVLPRLFGEGRQPRHGRLRDHGNHRRRRLCDGDGALGRRVRRRGWRARRVRVHPRDVRNHPD